MRSKDFIAEHRGGLLSKSDHVLLACWAADCAEHVVYAFLEICSDTRPQGAIKMARDWSKSKIPVGDARSAAFAAHDAAREIKDISIAACEAARSAGHAAATAHMADHSLQAAQYALKVIKKLSLSLKDEMEWQNEQLPEEIRKLVLRARKIDQK